MQPTFESVNDPDFVFEVPSGGDTLASLPASRAASKVRRLCIGLMSSMVHHSILQRNLTGAVVRGIARIDLLVEVVRPIACHFQCLGSRTATFLAGSRSDPLAH